MKNAKADAQARREATAAAAARTSAATSAVAEVEAVQAASEEQKPAAVEGADDVITAAEAGVASPQAPVGAAEPATRARAAMVEGPRGVDEAGRRMLMDVIDHMMGGVR